MLSTLDGERYARLRAAARELLIRPPLSRKAKADASTSCPGRARTARRLQHAVGIAIDHGQTRAARPRVHDARKAGKRLRYATEGGGPVVGEDAKRFAKGVKGFQTALASTRTRWCSGGVAQLGATGERGRRDASVRAAPGQDAALAAAIEEQLPALWAKRLDPPQRRWLR